MTKSEKTRMKEEDLHDIHLHCTGFVFLPNNKILF